MIQTFNKIGSRITAARCDLEAGPKMRIANRELAAVGGVVHRDDAARYRFAAVVGMQSESKPNAGRDRVTAAPVRRRRSQIVCDETRWRYHRPANGQRGSALGRSRAELDRPKS